MGDIKYANTSTSSARRSTVTCSRDHNKVVKGVKTGANIAMYIGSAGLVLPLMQNAREKENGILGACTGLAGAILSIGLGKLGSTISDSIIDKVVDFWDDVKPKTKIKIVKEEVVEEEDEEDG